MSFLHYLCKIAKVISRFMLDVVERLRVQAYAFMPASYIANYIYYINFQLRFPVP